MGGLRNPKGRKRLWKFDKELRSAAHRLNPRTTADINAAVLAVSVLSGYRP